MEIVMNQFVDRLNENRSLKPLYRNAEFSVELKGKHTRFFLSIHKGGCRRLPEINGEADVTILGKEKDLIRLLEGKERLLTMVQRRALEAKGPYRRLMKLESLFLLNGTEKYMIYQLS